MSERKRFGSPAVIVVWVAWCAMGCALSHPGLQSDASADRRMDADAGVRPDADAGLRPDADADVVVIGPDTGCPSGTQSCSGTCVATDTPTRCGSCVNDCTMRTGVVAGAVQCVAGRCVLTCMPGLGDCDRDDVNGCEQPLTGNAHCGACGVNCTAPLMCVPMADAGTGRGCGTMCSSPTTVCGTSCADLATDRLNCGACGMACPVPANGSATCAGRMCGIACNAGFHACSGACVSNTATATCGALCTACPTPTNSTATCDGSACGFACAAGFHACTGACVSNTSITSCGTSCMACPTGANATPACDGTRCSLPCNSGFHLCGSACVANNSTASCGPTSCAPCPTMADFTATCDGTSCGGACASSFHMCMGACVSNASPLTCGNSCIPCIAAANATAGCDGTACTNTCMSGFHMCAGGCVTNSSTATCGSSCSPCTPPANSTATCNGTTCGFTCTPPATLNGAMCSLPCGNRMLDAGETCDDGNVTAGDGCSATCAMEPNTVFESCGSGGIRDLSIGTGLQLYSGATGTVDDGSGGGCSADAPESVVRLRFAVAGSYTIRLIPNATFDVILRSGAGTCPGTGCENSGLAGVAEQITGTATMGSTLYIIIDGPNTTSTGTFQLSVNLI